MNAAEISIQLTIIEENARAARLAIAQAMVLRPHIKGDGNTKPILDANGQVANTEQLQIEAAYKHHNTASMGHTNSLINQAAHLQQTIEASNKPAEPETKLKLAES